MDLKRVNAQEAKSLMDREGYTLLDVRSIPEFEREHPEGAFNVPFLHKAPHGMVPNQEFTKVVQALFPDKKTKLVISCQMGGRSLRAAQELKTLGYETVVDLRGGFGSERDDYGKVLFPGWKDSDLPTEAGNPEGRSYAAIAAGMATQKQAQADACAPAPQAHAHSHAHSHAHPQQHALNRFAHPTKTVQCVKFGRDLPALKRVPMGGEIGKRIFDNVSADAWQLWVEHSKMIINEYRLNPAEAKAQELLVKQCEDFFFGEGAKLPEGYVPQAMAK